MQKRNKNGGASFKLLIIENGMNFLFIILNESGIGWLHVLMSGGMMVNMDMDSFIGKAFREMSREGHFILCIHKKPIRRRAKGKRVFFGFFFFSFFKIS